jgi:hypothetical protein
MGVRADEKGSADQRWARIIEVAYRLTTAGATVLRRTSATT